LTTTFGGFETLQTLYYLENQFFSGYFWGRITFGGFETPPNVIIGSLISTAYILIPQLCVVFQAIIDEF
jgi:hypothetical protein